MEENRIPVQSNWKLIEDIAATVYRSKIKTLTISDIKKIEESIDNGTPLFMNNSDAGEMNLATSITFNTVSIGFAAIQIVIAFLTWRFPYIRTDSKDSEQHQKPGHFVIDQSQIDEIVNSAIIELTKDSNEDTPIDVKEELQKRGKIIASAIVAKLKDLLDKK